MNDTQVTWLLEELRVGADASRESTIALARIGDQLEIANLISAANTIGDSVLRLVEEAKNPVSTEARRTYLNGQIQVGNANRQIAWDRAKVALGLTIQPPLEPDRYGLSEPQQTEQTEWQYATTEGVSPWIDEMEGPPGDNWRVDFGQNGGYTQETTADGKIHERRYWKRPIS